MDDNIKTILDQLSPEEYKTTLEILEEISNTGKSESLQQIYEQDFEELPVDIDTFIESDEYIGKFTGNGSLIYPYWREKLRDIFSKEGKYQEAAFTGCLSGDTLIPLLNGTKVSIKDLASKYKLDEWVYSYDLDDNKFTAGHLVDAFSTGIKDVYEITLDSGESFKATSNHKFLTRDKHWKSIDSGLSIDDSLMPCYRGEIKCGRGMYESIKHPQLSESNKDSNKNNKRQISKGIKIANIAIKSYGELSENTYQKVKIENNMRSGYPSYNSLLKRISYKDLYNSAIEYNHKIISIKYLGKEEVFDLTVERYHNFVIDSGIVAHNSIGTGKSTNACVAMSYLLYKTLCLRDPQKYYKLAAGSVIVFAFFNNTLDLSTSVGYGTLQNIVQSSPWFMERGTVTGTKYKEWNPYKLIRFRVGSQASHALGTNIISCLTGDTVIKTSDGEHRIDELDGEYVQVCSLSDTGEITLSNKSLVTLTKYTDEIYEIELEDGTILKCTPEHRFMLSNGEYKRADELDSNDDIKII